MHARFGLEAVDAREEVWATDRLECLVEPRLGSDALRLRVCAPESGARALRQQFELRDAREIRGHGAAERDQGGGHFEVAFRCALSIENAWLPERIEALLHCRR